MRKSSALKVISGIAYRLVCTNSRTYGATCQLKGQPDYTGLPDHLRHSYNCLIMIIYFQYSKEEENE